jgi:hypothetical protein
MAGGVSMVEILNSGLIESDDLDLTHGWVIRDAGTEILYVGTPETFTTYLRERNGGIQSRQTYVGRKSGPKASSRSRPLEPQLEGSSGPVSPHTSASHLPQRCQAGSIAKACRTAGACSPPCVATFSAGLRPRSRLKPRFSFRS